MNEEYYRIDSENEFSRKNQGSGEVQTQWLSHELSAPGWTSGDNEMTMEDIVGTPAQVAFAKLVYADGRAESESGERNLSGGVEGRGSASGGSEMQNKEVFSDFGLKSTGAAVSNFGSEDLVAEISSVFGDVNPVYDSAREIDAKMFQNDHSIFPNLVPATEAAIRSVVMGSGNSKDVWQAVDYAPADFWGESGWDDFGGVRSGRNGGTRTSGNRTSEPDAAGVTKEEIAVMLDEKLASLRVYVLESDITQAQNAVKSVVELASF